MENKKVEYKDYQIIEKSEYYVMAITSKEREPVRLDRKAFLDFEDVRVGDVWRLYSSIKDPNRFTYLSNLFNNGYYNTKFKDKIGKICTGIYKFKLGNSYIIKVDRDMYIRLSEYQLLGELKSGDKAKFLVENKPHLKRITFDVNKAVLKEVCDKLLEKNQRKIKLKILKIDEKETGVEYKVYSQEQNLEYKIYLRKGIEDRVAGLIDNTFYLERNCEIFTKFVKEKDLELYFRFDLISYEKRGRIYFSLDIEEGFKDILKRQKDIAKIYFDSKNAMFYIEKDCVGTCKLNTYKYSLVELRLLEILHGEEVLLELDEKSGKIRIAPFIFENDEIRDVVIIDRMLMFTNKLIYQLAYKDDKDNIYNGRMFIDEDSLDYVDRIFEVGDTIEKLKFKYSVKNLFNFYTRLPYIENPLITLYKEKKVGDTIIGRVKKVEKNYIEVLLGERYQKIILQKDLKQLSSFNIEDYYEIDKQYEFYIDEITGDDIILLGYNPEKLRGIFERIKSLDDDEKGDIIECRVKPCIGGYTGVYEELNEYIEVKLPESEISYIGKEINFKPNMKYRFKVYKKGLEENENGLLISRKRLSNTMKAELEGKYPIDSTIRGVYFNYDKEGLYFNLTDDNYSSVLGDLVGYLPYNKIELYPDKEEVRKNIFSKLRSEFKVRKYPKKMGSLNIREKAIELDTIGGYRKLADIIKNININDIKIDLERENRKSLIVTDDNKKYFETEMDGEVVVVSLDISENIDKLESLYENLKIKRDENEIYKNLFDIFGNKYSEVKVVFEDIDDRNNTVGVSIDKKIRNVIKNSEATFIQNIGDKYLFGDELLGIEIKIDEKLELSEGSYKCRIKKFKNNICILDVELEKDTLKGKEIKAKIVEKLEENRYFATMNNKIEIIVESVYPLFMGEIVQSIVKDIDGDKIIAEVIEKDILAENCASYINDRLRETIDEIDLKEIQKLIQDNSSKCKYIEIINGIEDKILTGIKRGKYLIEKDEFSNGAFGKVYCGIDLLNRDKVIQKRYCNDRKMEEFISFQNEAKLLQKLELDSVMKVFWYCDDIYIGEYITGKTYREYLKEKLDYKDKLDICIKIAEALNDIHTENIYHLDLKPENVMLKEDGTIKLIDFGASQSEFEEYGKYGTLNYSSPLQCIGYRTNEKTKFSNKDDIYSFGIMMYETFVGELPYDSKILGEDGVIQGHRYGRTTKENVEYRYITPREKNIDISEKLENIINKCLESDEDERYDDILDILDELEELYEEE